MKKILFLAVACLALGLVATGCGGDDEEDSGGSSADAPAKTTKKKKEKKPASGGGAAQSAKVSLKDIAFNPETVTVKKGGTVTWTNDESVPHDVTKTGGPGPDFKSGDSGGMKQGDTFQQLFAKPGEVDYVCTVHSDMKGKVVVK
jgi:plastocyanin